jgi:hypothetical protein
LALQVTAAARAQEPAEPEGTPEPTAEPAKPEGTPEPAAEAAEPPAKGTASVLRARGSDDQQLLTSLTDRARTVLRNSGYRLAPPQQTRSASEAVQQPTAPTHRFRAKDLKAIGRTLRVELVLHPRIVDKPGQPLRLVVDVARESKKKIWRCRRKITDASGRTPSVIAIEALEICLDRLLSPEPTKMSWEEIKANQQKVLHELQEQKPRELSWKKEHYFGTYGVVIPWGVQKVAIERGADRFVGYIDYEVSGAFGGFYEKRVQSIVALGIQLEYLMLWKDGAKKTEKAYRDERMGLVNLGATIRLLYPGKWAEPYAKLVLGITFVSPPNAPQNGETELGAGAGPNWELKLGTMITFPYIGIFIEAGFGITPWFPGDSVVRDADGDVITYDQITAVEGEVLLGFGLVSFF